MKVSIIYVNYKTAGLLMESIASVRKRTRGVSYEIIVVDNDSGDGSLTRISAAFPEVTCLQAGDNLGFGRANNLGIERASGEYLLFLNPDTLLLNDAVSLLADFLDGHPDAAVCGGNLFDEEGKPTTSFSRHYPSFFWEALSILYLSPFSFPHPRSVYFNHTGRPLAVASVIGADLMARRSVIDRVGGFAPEFFMNYEETELCHRIRKAGYGIYSFPEARITHLEGRASYIKRSRLSFLYEGQYIYFRKVYGIFGCRLIYTLTQLKSRVRIAQFVVLRDERRLAYWRMKLATNREVWRSETVQRWIR